jgi:hypothetical protein
MEVELRETKHRAQNESFRIQSMRDTESKVMNL